MKTHVSTNSVQQNQPQRRRSVRELAALMGPAFIVGAWQFGPGNLTSAVQAGSQFGYTLLWVIAVSTVLMLFFTDMSVRIAVAARGGSLIETVRARLGRATGTAAGLGVFFITLMFSVGNAIGAGVGLSFAVGGNPVWWTLATTAVVASTLIARRLYGLIEKLLLAVVMGMGICFLLTAILSRPDWGQASAGLLPTVPSGTGLLLVALVGTNFSINAAFYTGYASRERGLRREDYRDTTWADTIPGIVAPGIMTMMVIIAAAAVLGGTGAGEATLGQLANVLEPVAGQTGKTIFALGFFGAAFSSMIANATAGGTLLCDGLGWGNRLSSTHVKLGILAVLSVGAIVTVLTAGQSPVQMIIIAQALTVVVAPLLGVLLVLLANNGSLMGDLRNRPWQNLGAAVGLLAILATCYRLVTLILAS